MQPRPSCCGNAKPRRCRSSLNAASRPWKCRARGKRGKPKAGFPLFAPPLENLATTARFSHSHRPTDDDCSSLSKPKPKKGSRPLCGLLILLRRSPFGRAETQFHAHPSIGKCCVKSDRVAAAGDGGNNPQDDRSPCRPPA